jgi:putative phosphoribosyl transferase
MGHVDCYGTGMEANDRSASYRGEFANRQDAGQRLAKALTRYKDRQPIVLALPRGGVPIGFEIARALGAPLDVLIVRKLRAPGYPELGVGAVVDGPHPQRILNERVIESLQVTADYIEQEVRTQLQVIEERKQLYRRGQLPLPIKGRTVILADDGIATGGTVRAGLRALALAGAGSRVLAVPVAPRETIQALAGEADDLVCLLSPADFHSVSFYYDDFNQTTDDEVIELLQRQ